MDTDALLSLRKFYIVGDYERVLTEAKSLENIDKKAAVFRDVYVHRAHIDQGAYNLVLKAIDANAPVALQAVKLLASFHQDGEADNNKRENIFETLSSWISDESMGNDPSLQLVATQIYYEGGDYKNALKIASKVNTLDMLAMTVQIYLKINRLELAEKSLKTMQGIDDDDALTTLASVWVAVAQGGDKVKEAYEALQELVESGETVKLLNAQAACQILLANYTEAFGLLKQARDLAKQQNRKVSPDTLINTVVCLKQLQKPEAIIDKVIGELRESSPNHPYLKRQVEVEERFEKAAAQHQK